MNPQVPTPESTHSQRRRCQERMQSIEDNMECEALLALASELDQQRSRERQLRSQLKGALQAVFVYTASTAILAAGYVLYQFCRMWIEPSATEILKR